MTEEKDPPALSRSLTRTSKRPVGIWLLTALYVVPTSWKIWGMVELLLVRESVLDGQWWQHHRAGMYGPGGLELALAFSILLLASAIAIFLGVRLARYLLLVILAIVVLEHVDDIFWLSSLDPNDPAAPTNPSDWLRILLWPLGSLLWLLVNTWYLFGSRTQEFFRRSQLQSGHA